jgi:methanethiol S-methyltransferase
LEVILQTLLFVGISAALWSLFHSLFITHWWQRLQDRLWPWLEPWSRLVYVSFSTLSLGLLFLWWRSLPQDILFDWTGPWRFLRGAGVLSALGLFALGAAAFDNRAFLGLRQIANHFQGKDPEEPEFSRRGVLGKVRHPWYSGAILFLVFSLPVTDINLVWRGVFFVYILVGTELEERKLLSDLGQEYAVYRREVGRFFPARPPK